MSIFWGIDPGTTTSPTGLAIIEDGKLVEVIAIKPSVETIKQGPRFRIHYICNEVSVRFGFGVMPEVVGIETSFYQGKANQILNRFIGALENTIPWTIPTMEVNPMTLKKFFGSGKLEKEEIANILIDKWFTDKGSRTILRKIIKNKEWDLSDAVAIALYTSKCNF